MTRIYLQFLFAFLFTVSLHGEAESAKCSVIEAFEETQSSVTIHGIPIAYTATAGNLILKNEKCEDQASLFFVSYSKKDKEENRPITFCFNGGPGSSSVWLHLGAFGPKRVDLEDNGTPRKPYKLIDNPQSLLDKTDLVFIDPVGTGFSKAIAPLEDKHFFEVKTDTESIVSFIVQYLSKFQRWDAPKYVMGASYGSIRACDVADTLKDEYRIVLDGIIFISPVINYQTIAIDPDNFLPSSLFFPSYTTTAWYHKKLSPELQTKTLQEVIEISKNFVQKQLVSSLFEGSSLNEPQRLSIIEQENQLTGLSKNYLMLNGIDIQVYHYIKELLRNQKEVIGRFDSRVIGNDFETTKEYMSYDPSIEFMQGVFVSTFNQYIRQTLHTKEQSPYKILTSLPWKYNKDNQYLNLAPALKQLLERNPGPKVFFACGYYDLATPFFGAEYTINHLGLNEKTKQQVTIDYYESGHMMYLDRPSLIKLKKDLSTFYNK